MWCIAVLYFSARGIFMLYFSAYKFAYYIFPLVEFRVIHFRLWDFRVVFFCVWNFCVIFLCCIFTHVKCSCFLILFIFCVVLYLSCLSYFFSFSLVWKLFLSARGIFVLLYFMCVEFLCYIVVFFKELNQFITRKRNSKNNENQYRRTFKMKNSCWFCLFVVFINNTVQLYFQLPFIFGITTS